ncbi:MAG TPA: hypothetical protein VEX13_10175 [Chloroflexia bacterium]|nr:hypothetical protein [Chloroflexia bacterium]
MSAEANTEIVRRYFEEAFKKGHVEVIDGVVAPDYLNHRSIPGLPAQSRC